MLRFYINISNHVYVLIEPSPPRAGAAGGPVLAHGADHERVVRAAQPQAPAGALRARHRGHAGAAAGRGAAGLVTVLGQPIDLTPVKARAQRGP